MTRFYDGLADEYHLLFADWDASVAAPGRGPGPADRRAARGAAAPGAGLLLRHRDAGDRAGARGYQVHGTDISPAAVARAQREAARLGVRADDRGGRSAGAGRRGGHLRRGAVVRQRRPAPARRTRICAGRRAGCTAKLREGGLLVISMRDYDGLIAEKPRAELPRVFDRPDGRQIAFQVWDWDDRSRRPTPLHQYIVREAGGALADPPRGDGLPGAPARRAGRDRAGGRLPRGRLAPAGGDGLLPADPDGAGVRGKG